MTHKKLPLKMKTVAETIGKQIIDARSLRYSQTDVAEHIGISRSSLSYIESGKILPNIETLYNLCHFLELDIHDILPRQDKVFGANNKDEDSKESTPQADTLFNALKEKTSKKPINADKEKN